MRRGTQTERLRMLDQEIARRVFNVDGRESVEVWSLFRAIPISQFLAFPLFPKIHSHFHF